MMKKFAPVYIFAALAVIAFTASLPPARPQAPNPLIQVNPDPADTARLEQSGKVPIHVHDPSSIAECDDEYWIFYTGRGTPSYHSKDLHNWERGPHVFDTPPAWLAAAVPGNSGLDFWAPDVIHVGDRYLLYYAASTFGKNVSAIGLATTPTLNPADPKYHWTDQGIVVQSGPREDFNALDPAVIHAPDGTLWLAFGSFWSGIRLVQLDPATGKRLTPDAPVGLLAHANSIEASYLYFHDGYYYLFVDFGYCCRGVRSTYSIHVGRSRKITGPYVDKDGIDMRRGGGSLFMGSDGPFIGPGHTAILTVGKQDMVSCHFYDATQNGASYFAIRPLAWGADGWPVVEFVPAPPGNPVSENFQPRLSDK
jgi:arabinan endo-1,5-alpha-L-arabinosidase